MITLGIAQPSLGAYRWFRSSAGPRTLPVLMYHSISQDPEWGVSPYYKVCTSPGRFAEHMQWLAEAGFRGVTLSEGMSWLNGTDITVESETASTAAKPVAITFDDGFRDFHTEACPVLHRHGFTATMYLPTAFIGKERRSFKGRECLTWNEVAELHSAGMEFGSHTVNHPKLVELQWPEIETELRESKTVIEQQLQVPIPSFAYPYAFPQENHQFTQKLAQILQPLGYLYCLTTVIGRAHAADNPFCLKRLPANSCDNQTFFNAKTIGAYDWLAVPQLALRYIRQSRKSGTIRSG